MRIRRTDPSDPDFKELVQELDKDLWQRYQEHQKKLQLHNIIDMAARVILVLDNTTLTGCGCWRPINDDRTVEIKRMYVRSAFRGRGISKRILLELEKWAKEELYSKVILETGIKQPEAIGLYQGAGYVKTANYGPYKDIAESICMEKML